ncbi:hypothetical protein EI990_01605 [Streptococcus suis]|nr:hypothetical protein EI988_03850 [Streptococcus suis]RRR38831.1 hypothetical protein EI984_03330 [Streptococcus suis]RRR55305.1 hypothetical protein EI990_01605 [Streptococcus suis]RRR59984.1 hypothetical protein EI986_03075 [Streptococcus suis]
MIRSDLECKTRTNLPINHCAEMLTRTLRSEASLFPNPFCKVKSHQTVTFYSFSSITKRTFLSLVGTE